ncbi:MAG: hypothetical protein ACOVO0_14860 [Burkholderiaceae bacterium]
MAQHTAHQRPVGSALLHWVVWAGVFSLSACTTLLPTSKTEVASSWGSYNDAVASLAMFAPYQATRQDVHRHGLDPHANPVVTVLHFADVLKRFSPAMLIKPDEVDRGIAHCLRAGKQCSGYAISVQKLHRSRVGNFWLDSLNFKRETVTTGWNVEALLVFVDDQLVYELMGGQPTIQSIEISRNPLGPFQGWGKLDQ